MHARDGLAVGEGAAMLVDRVGGACAGARRVDGDRGRRHRSVERRRAHDRPSARDSAGGARAMRAARCATPVSNRTQVDFVSAHGTGTVYNDAMEMAALSAVFGESVPRVPVNSIKGAIGHTLARRGQLRGDHVRAHRARGRHSADRRLRAARSGLPARHRARRTAAAAGARRAVHVVGVCRQ